RSAAIGSARTPSARTRTAVSSRSLAVRATRATSAPAAASAVAIPTPMPRPAPVTIATRPTSVIAVLRPPGPRLQRHDRDPVLGHDHLALGPVLAGRAARLEQPPDGRAAVGRDARADRLVAVVHQHDRQRPVGGAVDAVLDRALDPGVEAVAEGSVDHVRRQ